MSSLSMRDTIKGSLAIGKIGGTVDCKKNVYVGESPEEYTEVWFDPSEEGIIDEVATKEFVEEITVKLETSLEYMEQQLQDGLNIDLSNYQVKTDNSLVTSDKTLVGAINEVFQSVSNGKVLVATAITDKGIDTSSDATFEVMASNISKIQSGGSGETPQIKTETRTFSGEAITCTHTVGNKTKNTKLTSISPSGVLGTDGKYHLKYRVENGVQHANQFDTRYSSTDYDFEIPYPLVGNGATNNEIRQKEDGTFEYVKRCMSASESNYCFEVPPLTPDEYNGRNNNYVYNDNKLYMICGSESATKTNKCYVYDFISGHWSTIADFPYKAYGVGVCYYQGKIYVVGGYSSGFIKDIHIYDIESNEWSATPMPTDKYSADCEYATCLIKDDIMYINKYNSGTSSTYLFIYDINSGTLTRSTASLKGLTSNTIVENDNKIYCSSIESDSQNTLCIYDIKNNSWEYIVTPENMNIFRSATALVGDKIYYVGGQYPSTNNKFISYNIKTKQFESLDNCNTICRSSYSFYRDNILYVIGGLSKNLNTASNSEFTSCCLGWRYYDFEKKYWNDIAPYGAQTHANSCSSYGDYVYTTGYSTSSIYKRNLETGEASLISTPNSLDYKCSFTTIYGDKMYVSNYGSKYLNIYDLTTNLWLDRINIPFYGNFNLTMDIHNGIIYMNGYSAESNSNVLFMLDLSTGSSDYIKQTYLNRYYLSSIVCGNKIYYFGGSDNNITYEYDIDTRNFKQLAPIPIPITHACCAEYNGNIYLIGGYTTGDILNKKIYIYNIANNTWSESIDLPSGVNGTCIVKGEYLYIFAGSCLGGTSAKPCVISNIYKLKIGDLQKVEEEIIPLEQDFNMTTKKHITNIISLQNPAPTISCELDVEIP